MQPANPKIKQEPYEKPIITKEGQLKDITAGVPSSLL